MQATGFFLSRTLPGCSTGCWRGTLLTFWLGVLDCALELSGRQPVRRAASALGFSLLCGGFWELVTPLYLARSTGDWRDVAAVCLGGLTMHGILKRTK